MIYVTAKPLGECWQVFLPCGCEGLYDADLVLVVAFPCPEHPEQVAS